MDIFARDDVSSETIDEALHGVECDNVTRVLRCDTFWLSQYLPTVCSDDAAGTGDLLRHHAHTTLVFDDTADRGWFRADQCVLHAKCMKQWIQLLLSEIRVRVSETFDLLHDTPVVPTLSFDLWCA